MLHHRTPPLDHLNGTNPDCRKSSRVHAENGERGGGEGRGKETHEQEEMVVRDGIGVRTEKGRHGEYCSCEEGRQKHDFRSV